MQQYPALFKAFLEAKGTKFENSEERIFKISYRCENMSHVLVYIFFDKDDDPIVQLKCWQIMGFQNKKELAYELCNDLNARFRWVKFFVDTDGDINCEADAILTPDTAGKVTYEMLQRMIDIIDTAYPEIAKARWA